MGFSSRKWAATISLVASRIYFSIIITQIPLFSFPCRIGTCHSPIEIMACQLIASEILPDSFVKILLYPGAIKESFMKGTSIPPHEQLLKSYKYKMSEEPAATDLKHLEVLAGSYLCVAGALIGLMQRGRMSLFGLVLIIWGVAREILMERHVNDGESLRIHPEMMFTFVIAFCSMRRDVRKLIKCIKPISIAKQLKIC